MARSVPFDLARKYEAKWDRTSECLANVANSAEPRQSARRTSGTICTSTLSTLSTLSTDMNAVIDFINTNRDKYVDELKAYLAIPSISALPQHAADVKRCAEWTADEMRRIGMENVKLVETPGYPVV